MPSFDDLHTKHRMGKTQFKLSVRSTMRGGCQRDAEGDHANTRGQLHSLSHYHWCHHINQVQMKQYILSCVLTHIENPHCQELSLGSKCSSSNMSLWYIERELILPHGWCVDFSGDNLSVCKIQHITSSHRHPHNNLSSHTACLWRSDNVCLWETGFSLHITGIICIHFKPHCCQ